MPYTAKKVGDQYCVYKKDGGEKVGCTDGNKESLRKYLAALHLNAKENTMLEQLRKQIHTFIVKELKRKSN